MGENAPDIEKRSRIINAALKEFSKNGYKKASTNNIVKEANVSKGLLYHYFGNKKSLHDHLIEFSFTTIIKHIENAFDELSSDFLVRLKQVYEIKMALMAQYPDIFHFAMSLMKEYSIDEVRAISAKYSINLISDIYYKDVDFTLFKDELNIEKTIKVIQWTLDKYADELADKQRWFEEGIQDEIDAYISIFRKGFYKEEACHD